MQNADAMTRELIESEQPLEGSLIELIVAATACTEDETELDDMIDALLGSGRVRLTAEPPTPYVPTWAAPIEAAA